MLSGKKLMSVMSLVMLQTSCSVTSKQGEGYFWWGTVNPKKTDERNAVQVSGARANLRYEADRWTGQEKLL